MSNDQGIHTKAVGTFISTCKLTVPKTHRYTSHERTQTKYTSFAVHIEGKVKLCIAITTHTMYMYVHYIPKSYMYFCPQLRQ